MTSKASINRERLALGIAALRSGEYTQGRGALKMREDGQVKHCCLGVLTEIAIVNGCEGVRVSPRDDTVFEDWMAVESDDDGPDWEDWTANEDNTMSPTVAHWFGFLPSHGVSAWSSHCDDPVLIITNEDHKRTAATVNDDLDDVSDFNAIADMFEQVYLP